MSQVPSVAIETSSDHQVFPVPRIMAKLHNCTMVVVEEPRTISHIRIQSREVDLDGRRDTGART